MPSRGGPVEILVVEDNPADAQLTREGFREVDVRHQIHIVTNGDEALAFLNQQPPFADAPHPDIVLLDLNMPGMSGRELLALIKGDPRFLHIPVIVLSASDHPDDVRTAYELHANCYLVKPIDLAGFQSVIRAFNRFWLGTATLPTHNG